MGDSFTTYFYKIVVCQLNVAIIRSPFWSFIKFRNTNAIYL